MNSPYPPDGDQPLLYEEPKPERTKGLKDYFRWILRRFWIPALTVIAGWLLGLYVYSNTPPTYQSNATIDVQRVKREAADVDEEERLRMTDQSELASTVERLKMPSLYRNVARSPLFEKREDIVPRIFQFPWQSNRVASAQDIDPASLGGMMKGWVTVRLRRDTTLIDLSATHSNPEIARDTLAALVTEYEKSVENRVAGSSEYALDYILDSSSAIKERLLQKEKTIRRYNRCLELSAEIRTAEREIAEMEKRYLPEWPPLGEARQLIGILKERFQTELDQVTTLSPEERDYWKANHIMLEGLDPAEQINAKINLVSERSSELTGERDAEQPIYDNLITKLKEGNLLRDFAGKQFELIEPPSLAGSPIGPNKKRILIMFLVGGLGAGVGIVLLLGFLDPTVRTVNDLEYITDRPVIGALPQWKTTNEERRLVDFDGDKDEPPIIESFRTLRAGLTFLGDNRERCSFVVTSAVAEEGKSWIASNLALAFARQGDRTLLIDADLRRPVQYQLFNYERNLPGLADHLSGRATLKEVIRRSAESEKLFLLPSGSRSANSAELLAGKNLPPMLENLTEHFDRIIIDSAPLIPVSDTVPLVLNAQSVVLVCRMGKTHRGAIRQAIRTLANNNSLPVGVVANGLPRTRSKSAYGYYYTYYGSGSYGKYGGYDEREGSEGKKTCKGDAKKVAV